MARKRYNGLKATLAASLAAAPTTAYSAAVLADTPSGYYRFGESSGNAADSSGNSRAAGTFIATVAQGLPSIVPSATDKSCDFQGGLCTVAEASWMTSPTSFSVECWVIADTLNGAGGANEIFVKDQDSSPLSELNFRLRSNAGKPSFLINCGGTLYSAESSTSLVAGTLYHLVGVYDATTNTVKIYINAALGQSTATSGTRATGTSDMQIGGMAVYGATRWDGRIDEVAFYPTALTSTQVSAHYTAGLQTAPIAVTFAAKLTHSNGTDVPTIASPDYVPLTILDSSGNLSEIVWLSSYATGATTANVTRGCEGTAAVAHASGDKIVHGPTAQDHVGEAWHDVGASGEPVFTNSWVAYTGSGGGFHAPGFRLNAVGEVELRGVASGGSTNTAIFTLPTGYRPTANRVLVLADIAGTWGAGVAYITPAGVVTLVVTGTSATSLDGLRFQAA